MTVAKRQVTTGVPGIAVRYDDGSAIQFRNIVEWLERKWPVAIALNWSDLRDTGPQFDDANVALRFRKSDIVALDSIARANGTELIPAMHSNSNWADAAGFTWQDILDEVDPRPIEDLLGRKVKTYVQPGDSAALAFVEPRRSLIIDALRHWGIEFAIGLQRTPSGAVISGQTVQSQSQVLQAGFLNSSTLIGDPTHAANGFQNFNGCLRPGCIVDPYLIPRNWTVDLGAHVVVRGTKDGASLLRDTHSGERFWALGEDNNGLGAEGASPLTNFSRVMQFRILAALGMGLWQGLAMHGDARNDTIVFGTAAAGLSGGRGSAGTPAALPGHFSSRHLADFCDRLRIQNHCRALTIEAFCEEIVSGFAEGTDLSANPGFAVPQIDADELPAGLPHCVYPRGISLVGVGISAHSSDVAFPQRLAAADASGRFVTPLPLAQVVGRSVAGYRGSEGGVILKAGGNADYSTFKLGQGLLSPGLYRLRVVAHDYTTGNVTVNAISAVGMRMRYRTASSLGGVAVAEPEFTLVQASGVYKTHTVDAGGEMFFEFYFDCPREARPMATGIVAAAVSSIAAGDTGIVGVATVPGARPGDQAWAISRDDASAAGVSFSAEVTAVDAVTITCHNDSLAAFSAALDEYVAIVDTVRLHNNSTDLSGPCGPWIYSFGLQFTKDSDTALTLSRHAFELVEAR